MEKNDVDDGRGSLVVYIWFPLYCVEVPISAHSTDLAEQENWLRKLRKQQRWGGKCQHFCKCLWTAEFQSHRAFLSMVGWPPPARELS